MILVVCSVVSLVFRKISISGSSSIVMILVKDGGVVLGVLGVLVLIRFGIGSEKCCLV